MEFIVVFVYDCSGHLIVSPSSPLSYCQHQMLFSSSNTAALLKNEVINILQMQGYVVENESFYLPNTDREEKRTVHVLARAERIDRHIKFIESFFPRARSFMRDSAEIDISKIKPRLIVVESGSIHANLFSWWNMIWWSLPFEKSYGRQMRFLVWDDYHDAPIGLIGLQSPILSWSVRDNHLGITKENRDYWVNQSMNAQRLGALPPYNKFLGGKLVAYLASSDFVRKSFHAKYKNYETILLKRKIPSHLLFLTTTGAYGKSSVYNRLKINGANICDFIGYSSGSGSFHIPDSLFEGFIMYLREQGLAAGREFGNGPSVKMKIINQAMGMLGFKKGATHGVKRAVYLFPFAENLKNVISEGEKPIWFQRSVEELTENWKERWMKKRMDGYSKDMLNFSKTQFVAEVEQDLENCKNLILTKKSS